MVKDKGKKRKADRSKSDNEHSSSMEDSLMELRLQLDALEGELFEVKAVLEKTTSELNEVKKSNSLLKEQLNENKHVTHVLNSNVNDLEQYSRRNNVRIFGIKDPNPKETYQQTENIVLNVLNTKLGMKISSGDIDIAHRIGRFQRDGNRAIIVKFSSRKCKYAVIYNRKRLKGSPIVISEDLTSTNHRRLQKIKELHSVTQAWTSEGKIFAKSQDGLIALVKSTVQINEHVFSSSRRESSQGAPLSNTTSFYKRTQRSNQQTQNKEPSHISQKHSGSSDPRNRDLERDRTFTNAKPDEPPNTSITPSSPSASSTPIHDHLKKTAD